MLFHNNLFLVNNVSNDKPIIRLAQLQNYHYFGNATGYIIFFYKKDRKLHKKQAGTSKIGHLLL